MTAPETIVANAATVASLAQKAELTYPAKDSHSYISPYNQSEHAWTADQHDRSNEVAWSKETNVTAAGNLDAVNNTGPSRLVPALAVADSLAQQKQQEKYRVETHSIIIPYVVRDNAWNLDHHDNSNFTAYKADSPAGYVDGVEFTEPAAIPDGTTNTTLLPCTTAEEAEYAAEVIANAHANLPAPTATCLTKAAAAAKNATCSVPSPTCDCNASNATNATNATAAATPATKAAGNSSNASKVCKVINASNATNATNATADAAPAATTALKVNATPAAKKAEVPKVTTPAANKTAETKKPADAKKVEAKKPVEKKPAEAKKVEAKKVDAKKPV